jgi:protein-S-isoprenylcysteine O-methyltransferase Ste14
MGESGRFAVWVIAQPGMQSLEHRLPPPLVFVILGAVMLAESRIFPSSPIASTVSSLIANALAWMALIFASLGFVTLRLARTTIDPIHIEAASTLVTTGIYRCTRNPMYVGLTCLLMAWSAHLMVPWTAIGPAAFVLFITRFQIIPEERALQRKFGSAYEDYRRRVRRWL